LGDIRTSGHGPVYPGLFLNSFVWDLLWAKIEHTMESGPQFQSILEVVPIEGQLHEFRPDSGGARSRKAKARRGQQSLSGCDTGRRILSVSYDQSLLLTREMLLSGAGFQVTSVRTLRDALECCKRSQFDLIIVGHSIPQRDKRELVKEVREVSPAPLLSIRRHGEPPLPEADHSVDALEGPAVLLAEVAKALGPK
jgi:CheY-like chemotaxis protein